MQTKWTVKFVTRQLYKPMDEVAIAGGRELLLPAGQPDKGKNVNGADGVTHVSNN